jgi:hypothetical protein
MCTRRMWKPHSGYKGLVSSWIERHVVRRKSTEVSIFRAEKYVKQETSMKMEMTYFSET